MADFTNARLLTTEESQLIKAIETDLVATFANPPKKLVDLYKKFSLLKGGNVSLPPLNYVVKPAKCISVSKSSKVTLSLSYPIGLDKIYQETDLPVFVDLELPEWDDNSHKDDKYFWWYARKETNTANWSFTQVHWHKKKYSTTCIDLDTLKGYCLVFVMVKKGGNGDPIRTALFPIIQEKLPRVLGFTMDNQYGVDKIDGTPYGFRLIYFFSRIYDTQIIEEEFLHRILVMISMCIKKRIASVDEMTPAETILCKIGDMLHSNPESFRYDDFSQVKISTNILPEPLRNNLIANDPTRAQFSITEITDKIVEKRNDPLYSKILDDILGDIRDRIFSDEGDPDDGSIEPRVLKYLSKLNPENQFMNSALGFERFSNMLIDYNIEGLEYNFFMNMIVYPFINKEEFTIHSYLPSRAQLDSRKIIIEKRFGFNTEGVPKVIDIKIKNTLPLPINDTSQLDLIMRDPDNITIRKYISRYNIVSLPPNVNKEARLLNSEGIVYWAKQSTLLDPVPCIIGTGTLDVDDGGIVVETFTDDGLIDTDVTYTAFQLWPLRILYSHRYLILEEKEHFYPSPWKLDKIDKTLLLGGTFKINLTHNKVRQQFPVKWPVNVGDLIQSLDIKSTNDTVDLNPMLEIDSIIKFRNDRARPIVFHKDTIGLYDALFSDAYNYPEVSVVPFTMMLKDSNAPLLAYERIAETTAAISSMDSVSLLSSGISRLFHTTHKSTKLQPHYYPYRVHHRHQGRYTILCSAKKKIQGQSQVNPFFLTREGKTQLNRYINNPRVVALGKSTRTQSAASGFWKKMQNDRDYFIIRVEVSVYTLDAYSGLPYNPEESRLVHWPKTIENPLIKSLNSRQLGYKSIDEYREQSGALVLLSQHVNSKHNKRTALWALLNAIRSNGDRDHLHNSLNINKKITTERFAFVVNGLLSNIHSISNLRGSTDQTRSLITPRHNEQLLMRLETALQDFMNLTLPFVNATNIVSKNKQSVLPLIKKIFTPSRKNGLVQLLHALLGLGKGIEKDARSLRYTVSIRATNLACGKCTLENNMMSPIDGLVIRVTLDTFNNIYPHEKHMFSSKEYFHLKSKVLLDITENTIVLDIINPIELLNVTADNVIDKSNGESVIDRKKISMMSAPWKDIIAVCKRPASSASVVYYPTSAFSNTELSVKTGGGVNEALSDSAVLLDRFTFLKHLYIQTLDNTNSLKNGEIFMSHSGLPSSRSNQGGFPQYPWELPNNGTGIMSLNSSKIQPRLVVGHYIVKTSPFKRKEFSYAKGVLILLNPLLRLLSTIRDNSTPDTRQKPYYTEIVTIIVNEIVDLLFNRFNLFFSEKYKLLTNNPDNTTLNKYLM